MTPFTIFFDLETGGLSPEAPIIQIAAIAVEDPTLREDHSLEVKVQFREEDADPEALRINRYDPEVWRREAQPPAVAARMLTTFMERYRCISLVSQRGAPYSVCKLAGFNAVSFDGPRLFEWFKRLGVFLPADRRVRCALQRALWYFDEREIVLENYKQPTIAAHFGIPTPEAHEALADVRTLVEILRRMRNGATA